MSISFCLSNAERFGLYTLYEVIKVPNDDSIGGPIFTTGLIKAASRGSAMICEGGLISVVYDCADTVSIYHMIPEYGLVTDGIGQIECVERKPMVFAEDCLIIHIAHSRYVID